ncbi:hypothetical protein FUAX_16670 [Fulvitalea axinellae]|uniref:Thioredoxin domain-containing protein n=1 Tax=Fulvitalea axinellae TaxID=1182444 RepID=A0AAU9DE89_9BACT|nr:hypothetical protein FUAX_16670 [Fulvitalea axinellae]
MRKLLIFTLAVFLSPQLWAQKESVQVPKIIQKYYYSTSGSSVWDLGIWSNRFQANNTTFRITSVKEENGVYEVEGEANGNSKQLYVKPLNEYYAELSDSPDGYFSLKKTNADFPDEQPEEVLKEIPDNLSGKWNVSGPGPSMKIEKTRVSIGKGGADLEAIFKMPNSYFLILNGDLGKQYVTIEPKENSHLLLSKVDKDPVLFIKEGQTSVGLKVDLAKLFSAFGGTWYGRGGSELLKISGKDVRWNRRKLKELKIFRNPLTGAYILKHKSGEVALKQGPRGRVEYEKTSDFGVLRSDPSQKEMLELYAGDLPFGWPTEWFAIDEKSLWTYGFANERLFADGDAWELEKMTYFDCVYRFVVRNNSDVKREYFFRLDKNGTPMAKVSGGEWKAYVGDKDLSGSFDFDKLNIENKQGKAIVRASFYGEVGAFREMIRNCKLTVTDPMFEDEVVYKKVNETGEFVEFEVPLNGVSKARLECGRFGKGFIVVPGEELLVGFRMSTGKAWRTEVNVMGQLARYDEAQNNFRRAVSSALKPDWGMQKSYNMLSSEKDPAKMKAFVEENQKRMSVWMQKYFEKNDVSKAIRAEGEFRMGTYISGMASTYRHYQKSIPKEKLDEAWPIPEMEFELPEPLPAWQAGLSRSFLYRIMNSFEKSEFGKRQPSLENLPGVDKAELEKRTEAKKLVKKAKEELGEDKFQEIVETDLANVPKKYRKVKRAILSGEEFFEKYKDILEKEKHIAKAQAFSEFAKEKGLDQNIADMVLSRYFSNLVFKGKDLKKGELLFDTYRSQLSTANAKGKADAKFQELKRWVANFKLPDGAKLNVVADLSAEQVLAKIKEKHKGKVIYLDLWATWCGPCKGEMPFAKKLKAKMKGKDVAFVYLCGSSREGDWKSSIVDMDISGDHYFLNREQTTEVLKMFDSRGFPTYRVFDKEGNEVKGMAGRPSNPGTAKSLEKLLNANASL